MNQFQIPFVKAYGLGNDFVLLQGDMNLDLRQIADRRYGIGCDQIIYYKHIESNVFDLRFFNQDGSSAEACGNGTRCAAIWLMKTHHLTSCILETQGGQLFGDLIDVNMVRISYPLPRMERDVVTPEIRGTTDAVFVGNPHLVCFTEHMDEEFETMGPSLESHPYFPNRTNVDFARILEPQVIELRVWERGTGKTPACGTGACATAFAAHTRGLVSSAPIEVRQIGGNLSIEITHDRLLMTGPAVIVFEGKF